MSGLTTSLPRAAWLVFERDLRLALRRWQQVTHPMFFFVIVTTLTPLALSPEPALLRLIAPAVIWVSALLSALLALESLFRADLDDGTLEQLTLSGQPLAWLLLAKTLAHWLLSGIPLVIVSPLVAVLAFAAPWSAVGVLTVALALGSGILSFLGAIGAALTLGSRRGSTLVSLLVLPLEIPVLVFAARGTDLAIRGESAAGPLLLLAAMLILAVTLAPLACAAAVRVSLE